MLQLYKTCRENVVASAFGCANIGTIAENFGCQVRRNVV